ncbi:hypothetical protein AMTR_s00513p00012320, partial [Amborella trichopoda]
TVQSTALLGSVQRISLPHPPLRHKSYSGRNLVDCRMYCPRSKKNLPPASYP